MSSNTYAGVPPSTYGVVWSRFHQPDRWARRKCCWAGQRVLSPASVPSFLRLVTYGQNHIKFWDLSVDPKTGEMGNQAKAGVFSGTKTHTVLSACFLPSGVVLSGSPAGGRVVVTPVWKRLPLQRPSHAGKPLSSVSQYRSLLVFPTPLCRFAHPGAIVSWKNARLQREPPAHATAPRMSRPAGGKMNSGDSAPAFGAAEV